MPKKIAKTSKLTKGFNFLVEALDTLSYIEQIRQHKNNHRKNNKEQNDYDFGLVANQKGLAVMFKGSKLAAIRDVVKFISSSQTKKRNP